MPKEKPAGNAFSPEMSFSTKITKVVENLGIHIRWKKKKQSHS